MLLTGPIPPQAVLTISLLVLSDSLHSSLLASILSSLSNLLGSPLAELLWCQAVGALVVAMLSELVYTSVLGALGGAAVGFATGYVGAMRASVGLVSHGSRGLLVRVGMLAARSLRGLARLLLRA